MSIWRPVVTPFRHPIADHDVLSQQCLTLDDWILLCQVHQLRKPRSCLLQWSDQNHPGSWWLSDLLQNLSNHVQWRESIQEAPPIVPGPWALDTAIQTWWVICWWMLETSRPMAHPTWQTRVVDALWPSSTRCSVSGRLWIANPPGCCALLADGQEPTWSPCDRTTWAGVSSSALVCTIVCLPRSWCKPQSLRCRTSSELPGTSDEAGRFSQRYWRPASPERWCATIFEMLTTVPVSSVSLTGLPSPNWTHPWRESLLSP